jgi:transposase InsO family protein
MRQLRPRRRCGDFPAASLPRFGGWHLFPFSRALDNVFVERLWRTVKYEEVYLRDYANGWQAEKSLGRYFAFYRNERPHQALGYRTPAEVYRDG